MNVHKFLPDYYQEVPLSRSIRFFNWIFSIGCTHSHRSLVMFSLRKSSRAMDIDTSKEYQYLLLPFQDQYWTCYRCGKEYK